MMIGNMVQNQHMAEIEEVGINKFRKNYPYNGIAEDL